MAEALRCVTSLPADSSSRITTILLCTDSLSGLQLLSRGPADQQTVLAQEVWTLLNAIVDGASPSRCNGSRAMLTSKATRQRTASPTRRLQRAIRARRPLTCRVPGRTSVDGRLG